MKKRNIEHNFRSINAPFYVLAGFVRDVFTGDSLEPKPSKRL